MNVIQRRTGARTAIVSDFIVQNLKATRSSPAPYQVRGPVVGAIVQQ